MLSNKEQKECIRRESNPELGHGKTQCYRYTTNACEESHISLIQTLLSGTLTNICCKLFQKIGCVSGEGYDS